LDEFYSTVDLSSNNLSEQLEEWQHYYNWHRGHGAHHGKTPMDRCSELTHRIPLWEEVGRKYDPSRERIQEQNYQADLLARRLEGTAKSRR
jgi:hypothetical protein